jgi:hypothetical protein
MTKDKWHFCYWDEPDFNTDKKKLINNKETKKNGTTNSSGRKKNSDKTKRS